MMIIVCTARSAEKCARCEREIHHSALATQHFLFPSRARKNVDVNFCSLYSAPLKGGDIAMAKKKSAKKTTKKTTKKGMKK
jgi:hypothetical protein